MNQPQQSLKDADLWLREAALHCREIGMSMPLDPVERAVATGMYQRGIGATKAMDQINEARRLNQSTGSGGEEQ